MKSYDVVAFTYEADIHCLDCTRTRFGPDVESDAAPEDSEGNTIKPVFTDQLEETDVCGTCGTPIAETV